MKKLLKKWLFNIVVKLMANRSIRTWTLCFALRHAPVEKILKEAGVLEDEEK